MARYVRIFLLLMVPSIFAINILGCAKVREALKCGVGISTQALEDERANALKKTVALSYSDCYQKSKKILARRGAYIYAEDASKQMIAIYISQEDTTCAGIFFTQKDSSQTEVAISSTSTFAKELVAKWLFIGLEKPLAFEDEMAEDIDAEE
ncbi:MAG: hypothetical protein KKC84_00680 [Candidatus Omnitrophica bacterium]|nr:hypothetical protein [Candidatus Omnitrophota bacterium]